MSPCLKYLCVFRLPLELSKLCGDCQVWVRDSVEAQIVLYDKILSVFCVT